MAQKLTSTVPQPSKQQKIWFAVSMVVFLILVGFLLAFIPTNVQDPLMDPNFPVFIALVISVILILPLMAVIGKMLQPQPNRPYQQDTRQMIRVKALNDQMLNQADQEARFRERQQGIFGSDPLTNKPSGDLMAKVCPVCFTALDANGVCPQCLLK